MAKRKRITAVKDRRVTLHISERLVGMIDEACTRLQMERGEFLRRLIQQQQAGRVLLPPPGKKYKPLPAREPRTVVIPIFMSADTYRFLEELSNRGGVMVKTAIVSYLLCDYFGIWPLLPQSVLAARR